MGWGFFFLPLLFFSTEAYALRWSNIYVSCVYVHGYILPSSLEAWKKAGLWHTSLSRDRAISNPYMVNVWQTGVFPRRVGGECFYYLKGPPTWKWGYRTSCEMTRLRVIGSTVLHGMAVCGMIDGARISFHFFLLVQLRAGRRILSSLFPHSPLRLTGDLGLGSLPASHLPASAIWPCKTRPP